jgi:hypothetical protein
MWLNLKNNFVYLQKVSRPNQITLKKPPMDNDRDRLKSGCFIFMEIWKDIEGYNGVYKVSNYGNVKSLAGIKERILKPYYDKDGYERVVFSYKTKRKNYSIHRLVASHFVSKNKHKNIVNHIDGVKTNNHASNLEWCTNHENILHAEKMGLRDTRGEKGTKSKLKEKDVLHIRSLKGVVSCLKLAKQYNVGHAAIIKIWHNKTWKHI